MKTKFFEGTDECNYGKFIIGQMEDNELSVPSQIKGHIGPVILDSFLKNSPSKFWILDIQTQEGAFFDLAFDTVPQLTKHGIWVCPMFPLFLQRCADLFKTEPNIFAWNQLQEFETGEHNAFHRPRQVRLE